MPKFTVEGSPSDGYRLWFVDTDGNLHSVGDKMEYEAHVREWANANGFEVSE